MKAIAVFPGQAGSIHLAELPKPSVQDIPEGRGVLVKVLLENYQEMMRLLTEEKNAIKVVVNVARG